MDILAGYAALGTEIEAGVHVPFARSRLAISQFYAMGRDSMDLTIVFFKFEILLLFCLTDVRQLKWTDICLGLAIPLVRILELT